MLSGRHAAYLLESFCPITRPSTCVTDVIRRSSTNLLLAGAKGIREKLPKTLIWAGEAKKVAFNLNASFNILGEEFGRSLSPALCILLSHGCRHSFSTLLYLP